MFDAISAWMRNKALERRINSGKAVVTKVDVEVAKETKPGGKTPKGSKASALPFPNYYQEEVDRFKAGFKPVTLLKPELLTESRNPENWPIVFDPQTNQKVHARITELRWLERGTVKVGNRVRESVRKVVYKDGEKFRESFSSSKGLFKLTPSKIEKLTESQRKAIDKTFEKLQENGYLDFDGGYMPGPTGWPGVQGLPYGAYVPYPPGPLTKQLYLQDMWEQQARAFQMYNHFDLIHGAIETVAAFVIGDGVRIQATDDEAQAIWDEFENRTEFQAGLPTECMQASVNGELMWHLPEITVDGQPGYVDFVSKDPGTCWEKITDPDDCRKAVAYYFNYPTRYMIVTKDGLPTTEYIVEMIDPQEMIHITFNVQKNEARGRSDIYSCLSDAKMLQDLMRYRTIKVMNAAGIVLWHQITGDQSDIQNIQNAKIGAGWLGAGTEIFTNESEKLEILKGAEMENSKSGLHDELLSQIANGPGLPSDYISSGGTGSRAAALTRTEPAAKLFRKKQKKFETPIKQQFRRVIQIAKKYGRIGADVSEECEVTFPEIAPENTKEKLNNIALAEQMEWITHKIGTAMAQKELDITSPPDYDEMQKEIQQEKQTKLENDPMMKQLMAKPTFNPDTGALMPGQAGPSNPNSQGKVQSKGAYNGDKMGLSNDSKQGIKRALQAKSDHVKGEKKAHKALHHTLRSRTKDTIQTLSDKEAGSSSTAGSLLRGAMQPWDTDVLLSEHEAAKKAGFYQLIAKSSEMQAAPPGWEPTVKKMKDHPEIDNPFALAWWMSGNGYEPGGSDKK